MRIAIVNDLNIAVESLRRVINATGNHKLAWIARNGAEAVNCCKKDTPDLILMDMIMPVMNGVAATRRIMKQSPCPILIVTSSVTDHASMVFEAMGFGALDAVVTPVLTGVTKEDSVRALLSKVALIGKLTGCRVSDSRPKAEVEKTQNASLPSPSLIAIGCSTGGPSALVQLLSSFPEHLDAAVIVIQHMDEIFTEGLANWLDRQTILPVNVPFDGEPMKAGKIYIPRTSGHMILDEQNRLIYTDEPKECFYHPSVDVFFHSVARNHHSACVGVLLTGMGRDGGDGLLALKKKGFLTVAQDRETSVVYGMPRYAKEIGAAQKILPIGRMGKEILQFLPDKVSMDI